MERSMVWPPNHARSNSQFYNAQWDRETDGNPGTKGTGRAKKALGCSQEQNDASVSAKARLDACLDRHRLSGGSQPALRYGRVDGGRSSRWSGQ